MQDTSKVQALDDRVGAGGRLQRVPQQLRRATVAAQALTVSQSVSQSVKLYLFSVSTGIASNRSQTQTWRHSHVSLL